MPPSASALINGWRSAKLYQKYYKGSKTAMFRLWKKKEHPVESSKDRLDSWKEIAAYLRRDISTLHRWEKAEGLPVHRHRHDQLSTVYAYRSELDAWWNSRHPSLDKPGRKPGFSISYLLVLILIAALIGLLALAWIFGDSLFNGKRLSPSPEPTDWVLITDFKNTTGDPLLDGSLEYALELELSSSGLVRVVSRPRIEDTLRLMKKPLDSSVDLSLGKEICIRDGGIKTVIDGAIEKLDSRYRLSVRIVDPISNISDRTQTMIVEGESEILEATHQLANWLRQNLGNTLAEIEVHSEPLHRATTPSLKAVRLFTLQDRLQREGKREASVGLLRAAIAEDPEFASAYAWLAWALKNSGRPVEEYLDCAQRAADLSQDVSEWERYYIFGIYHSLNGQWELTLPYWEGLWLRYPNEYWGYNQLRFAYVNTGRSERLVDLSPTVASLRPDDFMSNWAAANDLSRISFDFARAKPFFEKARALADRDVRERWPFHWAVAELYRGATLWTEEELPQILKDLEKARSKLYILEEMPRKELASQMAHQYLCLGRISNAKALADEMSEDSRSFIFTKIALAGGITYQPEGLNPLEAMVLARSGHVDKAETMLSNFRNKWSSRVDFDLDVLAGEIALAKGQSDSGIELLRETLQSYKKRIPYTYSMFTYLLGSQSLAVALKNRGDLVEAAQVLERALAHEDSHYAETAWIHLDTRWNLAQIYRQLGRMDSSEKLLAELKSLLRYGDKEHPILRSIREAAIR